MTEEVKLITARRAYEFRPNELRLSMLSLEGIRERIQQIFSFDTADVRTPPPTFGSVQFTMPPGVVFSTGGVQVPENMPVPIRFMHFEPARIVIDVAGPSSAIDYVFERVQTMLAEVHAPDGSSIIGGPWRVLDYSEISAKLAFGLDKLFSESLHEHASGLFGENRKAFPAGIRFLSTDGPGGSELPDLYTLEIRDANQIEDRIYISSADLATDQHLAWVEALERREERAGGQQPA